MTAQAGWYWSVSRRSGNRFAVREHDKIKIRDRIRLPVGDHAMRIYGSNGTALAKAPAGARRAASGGFSVGEQAGTRQPAAAGSLRSISTVDALLALQGVEDFTARKKRAVAKGRKALDALDSLKLGLLDGNIDNTTIAHLKVAADGLIEETGDAHLDQLMRAIDLRLAVELAKAGAS
jgi:hypothetical protein